MPDVPDDERHGDNGHEVVMNWNKILTGHYLRRMMAERSLCQIERQ